MKETSKSHPAAIKVVQYNFTIKFVLITQKNST